MTNNNKKEYSRITFYDKDHNVIKEVKLWDLEEYCNFKYFKDDYPDHQIWPKESIYCSITLESQTFYHRKHVYAGWNSTRPINT